MAKRGRKPGTRNGSWVATFADIAILLGCSERTIQYDYQSAISKLKQEPGAYAGLLYCIHAVAASERDILQPGSVECRADWVNLFAPE